MRHFGLPCRGKRLPRLFGLCERAGRVVVAALVCVSLTARLSAAAETPAFDSGDDAAVVERLRESVTWLAAPEREGRGPGTDGISAAAGWIAEKFEQEGLAAVGSIRRQPFTMTLEATLPDDAPNRAELVGPPGADGMPTIIPLEFGVSFTPLAAGGSGPFDLPLVFAGYGITAPAEDYDDYAPLGDNAKAAAAVVLRQEPQKENPHSVFNGNQASQHAALARKIANASEHEAGGVIFCNDATATEPDALMDFRRAGGGENARTMPVLQISRSVVASLIEQATETSLAAVEEAIDRTLTPQSQPLNGWRIRGEFTIERQETAADNIVAVLPGMAGAGRDVVVLGAHYDHLGYGDSNSLAPGTRAVHHGADDNASGTAMLVEVARQLQAAGPLPRTVLFVAFAGEERGLLGSGHYTANPLLPLERTAAMVNLDMVGRLDDDSNLILHGTGTGTGIEALVDRLAEAGGFTLAKEPGGFGPSDHASFYAREIPVLHVFTGSHTDYHRPTDTADKINYEGMARISRLIAAIVRDLATMPAPPEYVEVASKQFQGGGGDRPYFGSIPDFAKPGGGYAITGVSKGSPAATGGLQGGDVIVRLGDSSISGLEDFDSALRKHKAGEAVPVVVRRDGQERTLSVTLGDPR